VIKALKIFIVLFLLLSIAISIAVLAPAKYFVARRSWEIDYYGDATRLEIRRYEITGRPNEIRSWLESPHDGAFGTVIAINILEWGLYHPDDFVYILEGINVERRDSVVEWLGWMVDDMRIADEFLEAFRTYSSPAITQLKAKAEASKR